MATLLSPVRFGLALLMLGAAAVPRPARAQATAADTAAILLDAAGRLEREGRGDAAAALLEYIRTHYATTPAAAEAARRVATVPRESIVRRELRGPGGRTELIVWGTTYGIWAGLAVPAAMNAHGPSAYGLGLLVGAPAGLLISRAYASRVNLTEGAARSITFGGTWGTWQGFGVAKVIGILEHKNHYCFTPQGGTESCYDSKSTSSSAVIRSMLVGGLAGIGAGAVVGQRNQVSPGTATAVSLAALWGTWYGVATGTIVGLEDDRLLTAALVGGDAALLAAAAIAPRIRVSRERARIISIAGLAGALAGGGIDLLIQVDNEKVGLGIPMATGTAGLLIGAAATSNMPPEAAPTRQGSAPGGALLRLENGRVGMDVPSVAPMPAAGRGGHARAGTALYVPLLHASF